MQVCSQVQEGAVAAGKGAESEEQAGQPTGSTPATVAPSSPRLLPADHLLLASCIAEHLGPLLADPYIAELALVPFLLQLHGRSEFHSVHKLQRVLSLLLAVLEDHELDSCMHTVIRCLGAHAATASLQSQQLPYSSSYAYVALAGVLVSHPRIAVPWVKSPLFHEHLEQLLTVKQPAQRELEALLPQVRLLPPVLPFSICNNTFFWILSSRIFY